MTALLKERVLLVDDEPQVLVALEDLLCDDFTVLKTDSPERALTMMQRHSDIAVLVTDQRMPNMSGDDLLARIGDDAPISRIMVTGFADLTAVVRAINEGRIFAYVTKPWSPEDLRVKVMRAAEHFRLAQELEHERARLREQTRILNSVLDSMGDAVVVADEVGEFLVFNRQAERLFGKPGEMTTLQSWVETNAFFLSDQKTPIASADNPLVRAISGHEMDPAELFVKGTTGGAVLATTATPLTQEAGRLPTGMAVFRDVTKQRSLEQQLTQAQKMEAIGRLAGGVAHDFNNLLAVITGYGELLIRDLKEADPIRGDLREMLAAAQRASSLTRQLLAFSRRQVVHHQVLDLNEVVSNVTAMLRRLIGEDVDLKLELAPGLASVKADAGQIEQILLNLSVNARDAMPDGGCLTIETANCVHETPDAEARGGLSAREFVMLAVSDTGTGMDVETQQHIFEPFFTTKAAGQGTGLGLSTVYGIVQQSEGQILVCSELGQGTTFKVLLPREAMSAVTQRPRPSQLPVAGVGTVLVVEDDDAVRQIAVRILRSQGYTVYDAKRAGDARRICVEHGERLDLLLTDVVMPEVSGPKLAEELTRLIPGLRVLYMSGYPGGALLHHGSLDEGTAYIEKPFTPSSLTQKVHDVLMGDG